MDGFSWRRRRAAAGHAGRRDEGLHNGPRAGHAVPFPFPLSPSPEVFTTEDGVRFQVETLATGFEIPWSMAFAPDGRLFVTERPGRVRILDLAARTSALALTLDEVYTQSEAGLLGLALDPEFTQNRLVYLYHSAPVSGGSAVNRVVRYREAGSRLSERVVLVDNIPAAPIHDGGRLRFGPDGLLYITTGDAANTNTPQDLASLAGKFLRINRDGTTVTRVGRNTVLIHRDLVPAEAFAGLILIDVDPDEPSGANALLVGDVIVYPATFPRTRARLTARGLRLRTVEVDELQKAEGAVTCCSVIFEM